jgi:hypothetical protein
MFYINVYHLCISIFIDLFMKQNRIYIFCKSININMGWIDLSSIYVCIHI